MPNIVRERILLLRWLMGMISLLLLPSDKFWQADYKNTCQQINGSWDRIRTGALSVGVLVDYLNLWELLSEIPGHSSFMAWWEQISGLATGLPGKGLNSLVALGAWITWKHRNSCFPYKVQYFMLAAGFTDEDEIVDHDNEGEQKIRIFLWQKCISGFNHKHIQQCQCGHV
ncbi:hypothetical protein ACJX0J_015778, partial [Zea mays]